jgi:hypothetical protein
MELSDQLGLPFSIGTLITFTVYPVVMRISWTGVGLEAALKRNL